MNIKELNEMSDAELNELSAVKVMEYDKEGIDIKFMMARGEWNPTTDMNDAWLLMSEMRKSIFSKRRRFMETLQKVVSEGKVSSDLFIAYPDVLWDMSARDITITSILVVQEQQITPYLNTIVGLSNPLAKCERFWGLLYEFMGSPVIK